MNVIQQIYKSISSGDTSLPAIAVDTTAVLSFGFLIAGLLIAFNNVPALRNK